MADIQTPAPEPTNTVTPQASMSGPAAPTVASGGSKTMLMAAIGIIVVIAVVAGAFLLTTHGSSSGSKQSGASTTIASRAGSSIPQSGSNSTTTYFPQSGSPTTTLSAGQSGISLSGCDYSNVAEIIETFSDRPGANATYMLSNSNVIQITENNPGQPPTTINSSSPYFGSLAALPLEGLCGSITLTESMSLETANGGNTNGQWFSAPVNGTTGYFNIDNTNANTESFEWRVPYQMINGTAINGVFLTQIKILKKTGTITSLAAFMIPGTNPMTSTPFGTMLKNANATTSQQLEYDVAVAYDPSLKSYYPTFASYQSQQGNQTQTIGYTNATYILR